MGSESAIEFIAHEIPTSTPPASITGRGPKRSTSQPSIGTSQVSASTKIVNATWIAVRPHWNLSLIGLTNKVHPYCRLAIIDMQMMPISSCHQRPAVSVMGADLLEAETAMTLSLVRCPQAHRLMILLISL